MNLTQPRYGKNCTDDDVCTLFYSALGAGVIKILVENRLTVKNHFLYSTGELLNLDGEYNQVSLGLFGHVFTFKKEDLDEALSEAREVCQSLRRALFYFHKNRR